MRKLLAILLLFSLRLSMSGLFAQDPKCTDCHGDQLTKKNVHAAAADSCVSCHLISVKEHPDDKVKGLQLRVNMPELCYKCHDPVKKEIISSTKLHSAMHLKGSCTACHSPHSSDFDKLLKNPQNKLCINCHNKNFSSTGAPAVNMKSLLANSKVIHAPVKDDVCMTCHKQHSGKDAHLLNNTFPLSNYPAVDAAAFGLCWDCHDQGLFTEAKTESATNFRNGGTNLHFIHLNSGTGRSCSLCHNVHGAPNEHLIEDRVKFGQWNLPIRYIPAEKGGSCAPGCHQKKSYLR
jgi:predicted CXXCH cytochrome family protein